MTYNGQDRLAAHESLEIHELLNFKTLCLAKSKLMMGLAFDQELKALMELDVQHASAAIMELQQLYELASYAGPVPENRPVPIVGQGGNDE